MRYSPPPPPPLLPPAVESMPAPPPPTQSMVLVALFQSDGTVHVVPEVMKICVAKAGDRPQSSAAKRAAIQRIDQTPLYPVQETKVLDPVVPLTANRPVFTVGCLM